jgi:hypothetical protein
MKTLSRVRNRKHRCYELSFKAMLYEPAAESFTLVHGARYIARIMWTGHAWIETSDGRVYDAVDNAYTPTSEYMASAIAERRYTKLEAMNHYAASGHCGPWHDGEDFNLRYLTAKDRRRLSEWQRRMKAKMKALEFTQRARLL